MSYRKTGTASYNQRRQVMQRFREEWSKGLPAALTKAAQMEKDGWQIDTSRTLTAAQAKERVNELTVNGFDSEAIPIATWDGEQVVLLAAKAKAVKPASSTPSTPSTAQTSSSIAKMTRFVGAFGQGLYDGGIVSSKDHSVTFISDGANPTGRDKNPPLWLELADGIKKNIPSVGVVDNLPLLEAALENNSSHSRGWNFVAFDPNGESAIDADLLLPALKVFPDNTKVMLFVNQVGLAMLEDKEGDRILIGPNYKVRPTAADVVDLRTLLRGTGSGTSTRV